jgi:hypothetical protein
MTRQSAAPSQGQGVNQKTRPQKNDGHFGHAGDPGDQAQQDPEPAVPRPEKPGERVQESSQDQLVDAVVAEDGIDHEPDRDDDEPQGAQRNGKRFAAELLCDQANEDQCGRAGQRRNDMQRE